MLNYYTQFIGLDGKIEKQRTLLKKDKHDLEKRVEELEFMLREIREQNIVTQSVLQRLAPVASSGGAG